MSRSRYGARSQIGDGPVRQGPAALEAVRLAVITDAGRARGRSLDEQIRLAVRGGAGLVLARAPELEKDTYADCARRWRGLVPAGVLFGVYDDPALADELGAVVQLGADDVPVAEVRRDFPDLVIGYSAHSLTEAVQASRDGADYVLLSLLFPTTKDGGERAPLDEDVWTNAYEVGVPVFALGGVTVDNLPRAWEMGVRRVAVSSGVVGAADPVGALRVMNGVLGAGRKKKKKKRQGNA